MKYQRGTEEGGIRDSLDKLLTFCKVTTATVRDLMIAGSYTTPLALAGMQKAELVQEFNMNPGDARLLANVLSLLFPR